MNWLKWWLPACVWAVVISTASMDAFSAEHTSRIILPFLRWLLPHAPVATLELLHLVIRKCAHFAEYFLFSLLLLRAVRGKRHGWMLRWALIALAIAAAYSVLDEFHQSFVPSWTASPWDSLLDTFGASVAQLAIWAWFRHYAEAERRPAATPTR
jgi:VanZ family protein